MWLSPTQQVPQLFEAHVNMRCDTKEELTMWWILIIVVVHAHLIIVYVPTHTQLLSNILEHSRLATCTLLYINELVYVALALDLTLDAYYLSFIGINKRD